MTRFSLSWPRLVLGTALLALSATTATAHDKQGEGGLCEAQIRDYVTNRLGQDVDYIRFHWAYGHGPRGASDIFSYAVVYTKQCPGFHGFDIDARYEDCALQTYYGKAPNFLRYSGGEQGC